MTRALFLAARGARSQAYAQAMKAAGLMPQFTMIFGPQKSLPASANLESMANPPSADFVVPLPDLREPLEKTCEDWPVLACDHTSVNDPAMVAEIRRLAPTFVIYSGVSGEIVGADALASAPFLHLHSGWLPDYRGSTTIYYSLLKENYCGVSALLLDARIDTGPVLARHRYPAPPAGVDIDYLYDPAIRADLLIRVLREVRQSGSLPAGCRQDSGNTYFVIHPVLKNLALQCCGLPPRSVTKGSRFNPNGAR